MLCFSSFAWQWCGSTCLTPVQQSGVPWLSLKPRRTGSQIGTLGTLTLASLGSNSVTLGPAENEMSPSGLIREMRGCPRPCHCLFILGPDNSHGYCFKCQHYIFIFLHGALFNEHCWLLNRQSILFKAPCLQRIFSLSVLIIVKVFLKVFNHSFSCSSTYYIYIERLCSGFTHIISFNPHDNPVL